MSSLLAALHQSLPPDTVGLKDQAIYRLAERYAREIDEGGALKDLGPKLLATLESLLITPKARATILKGADDDGSAVNPIDELRARRERRAQAVDTTTT